MVYNYFVRPGESFNVKTPGSHTFDDISKNIKMDRNGEIIINHSIYPDGFEITMTQLADRINVTTNMELIKNPDGTYSIKYFQ